jgi:hypothetical protein
LLYVESVLIWLLFVVAIFYAMSFFVIPSVAEAKLKKLCGGSVNIQSGRFGGFGKIHLAGVVIAEDDQAILNAPILLADQVEIQLRPRHKKMEPWRSVISKINSSRRKAPPAPDPTRRRPCTPDGN